MPLGDFDARVDIDPAQLAEFLRSPAGPVFREMVKVGDDVKDRARDLVGVHKTPPAGPDRERRPGTLRDSIVKRIRSDSDGPYIEVGSEDDVALWQHEGTVPHEIVPVRAPRLVFWWDRVGGVVSFLRVYHPGTQPNRFLTDARDQIFRERYR